MLSHAQDSSPPVTRCPIYATRPLSKIIETVFEHVNMNLNLKIDLSNDGYLNNDVYHQKMPQQLFERFLVFLLLPSHLNSNRLFPQIRHGTGAEIRIAGTVSRRDDKPGVDQGAATQVCHEHHGNLWKEVLAMITQDMIPSKEGVLSTPHHQQPEFVSSPVSSPFWILSGWTNCTRPRH